MSAGKSGGGASKDIFGSDDESDSSDDEAVVNPPPAGDKAAAAGAGGGGASASSAAAKAVGLDSDSDDDSDGGSEDEQAVKPSKKTLAGLDSDSDDDDNDLQDSDASGDEAGAGKGGGKTLKKSRVLSKGKKQAPKGASSAGAAGGGKGAKRARDNSKSAGKGRAGASGGSSRLKKRSREEGPGAGATAAPEEYDSDNLPPAESEDDDFIDREGDDDELVADYDAQDKLLGRTKAKFDEAEEAEEDGKEEAPDGQSWLDQAMQANKRVKGQELNSDQREDFSQHFLYRMNSVAEEDEAAVSEGVPAMAKLKMLKIVTKTLNKKELQDTLLDYDLLGVMARWIQPYSNNTLPNLSVRKGIFALLFALPCQIDHLKRSGVGKVVLTLWKHPEETAENKAKLRSIIEKWNRPIFQKDTNMRAFSQVLDEREMDRDRQRTPKEKSRRGSGSSAGGGAQNLGAMLQSDKKKDDGGARVRIPYSSGFSFKYRPQSKVSAESVRRTPKDDGGARAQLSKRMQDVGRGKKKIGRAANVNVEGRNMNN